MALLHNATALVKGAALLPRPSLMGRRLRPTIARAAMAAIRRASVCFALFAAAVPASAANDKVRITALSDVAFGTIANLSVDAINSQSVCVYSSSATSGYHVTASGDGPSGAFQLLSGAQVLPFDVQWSATSGQTSGTELSPNVPLTGQVSTASQQTCNSGAASSASLVVILRASALTSASAGTYSGTLTLLVGPE